MAIQMSFRSAPFSRSAPSPRTARSTRSAPSPPLLLVVLLVAAALRPSPTLAAPSASPPPPLLIMPAAPSPSAPLISPAPGSSSPAAPSPVPSASAFPACPLTGKLPQKPKVVPSRCPGAAELSCCDSCTDLNSALMLVGSTLGDLVAAIDPALLDFINATIKVGLLYLVVPRVLQTNHLVAVIDPALLDLTKGTTKICNLFARQIKCAQAMEDLVCAATTSPSLSQPFPPLPRSDLRPVCRPDQIKRAQAMEDLLLIVLPSKLICDLFAGQIKCAQAMEDLVCAAQCNPDAGKYIKSAASAAAGANATGPTMTVCPAYAEKVFASCQGLSVGDGVSLTTFIPDAKNFMSMVVGNIVKVLGVTGFTAKVGATSCFMGTTQFPPYIACCDPLAVPPTCPATAINTTRYASIINRPVNSSSCQAGILPTPAPAPAPAAPPAPPAPAPAPPPEFSPVPAPAPAPAVDIPPSSPPTSPPTGLPVVPSPPSQVASAPPPSTPPSSPPPITTSPPPPPKPASPPASTYLSLLSSLLSAGVALLAPALLL
ncbi:unnamed protein product [Closterium sp. Naga37s-1]|nr:unnamed protein product [Closterium sp. Naga37s-1]